jgi:hypothetical protein
MTAGSGGILSLMNCRIVPYIFTLAATIFLLLPAVSLADDSAVSIAAGGLVARRETRVVMAKEVLKISPTKVTVDYDFRNDSNQDVATEVAFPIPPYSYDFDGPEIASEAFSGFRLIVNGKPVAYQIEAKATLNGKDVTSILASDKIDIPTFGHLHETADGTVLHTPDMEHLPKTERERLVRLGLFGTDRPWGTWTVHLQYHWTQTFPVHSTVHIRHEYTPVEGYEMMPRDAIRKALHEPPASNQPEWQKASADDVKPLAGFCPDLALLRGVERGIAESNEDDYAHPHWVDFILTSANTWKQPIEDFTLIVERGRPVDGYGKPIENEQNLISFCSPQNALVEKLDTDRFQVHLTNFVPKSELRIGFFDIVTTGRKTGSSPSKK